LRAAQTKVLGHFGGYSRRDESRGQGNPQPFGGSPSQSGRATCSGGRPLMKRLTIQAMTWLASVRGGRCLSLSYVNRNDPLEWECAAGHRWSAAPASITKGSWCPECAGVRRLTLDEMQRLAESRGGRCLSKCCLNGKSKLIWRCSADHQWSATASQVKQGHWCPFCARVARLACLR
jgi:hypothetical protein